MQGLPAALDRHVDERFSRLEKRAAEREFKLDEARRNINRSMSGVEMPKAPPPSPPDTEMPDAPPPQSAPQGAPQSATQDVPNRPPGRQPSQDVPMQDPPPVGNPMMAGHRNAIRLRYVPPTRITLRTHTHEVVPVVAPRPPMQDMATSYNPNVSGVRRAGDPLENPRPTNRPRHMQRFTMGR